MKKLLLVLGSLTIVGCASGPSGSGGYADRSVRSSGGSGGLGFYEVVEPARMRPTTVYQTLSNMLPNDSLGKCGKNLDVARIGRNGKILLISSGRRAVLYLEKNTEPGEDGSTTSFVDIGRSVMDHSRHPSMKSALNYAAQANKALEGCQKNI